MLLANIKSNITASSLSLWGPHLQTKPTTD